MKVNRKKFDRRLELFGWGLVFFNASLSKDEIAQYRGEIIRLGELNPTKITGDHLLN